MEDLYTVVLGGAILVAVVIGFYTKTYPLRTAVFILLLVLAKPIAVNVGGFLCNLTPSGCHRDGRDGRDGINGKDGLNSQSGNEGKDGQLGKDGATGLAGEQGKSGKDGRDGQLGQNGKDGKDDATASPSVLLSTGNSSVPIAVGATKPRFAAIKISGNSTAVTVRLFDNTKREWLDEDTHKVKPEPELGERIEVDGVQAVYVGTQAPDHEISREENAPPAQQTPAVVGQVGGNYESAKEPAGMGVAQANAGTTPVTNQGGQVSAQQLQDADAELNRVYQNLRSRLNPAQKDQLKTMQREWIQNRDAAIAKNPTNANDINYQATVARTAQLKQVIPDGGGVQSTPNSGDGSHYRMTADEMMAQARAVEPILNAMVQAGRRGDNATVAAKYRELIQRYPMCPATLVMQMEQAFRTKHFNDANALYNRLVTEYPDVGESRANAKKIYQQLQQKYGASR